MINKRLAQRAQQDLLLSIIHLSVWYLLKHLETQIPASPLATEVGFNCSGGTSTCTGVVVASSGERLQGTQVFPKLQWRWGEPHGNYWGSSHLPYIPENKSRTELDANSLGRHLLDRHEKSLQDHIAMQYEQQSTELALKRRPGCRLLQGQGWGQVSRRECRRCLERGYIYETFMVKKGIQTCRRG